MLFGDLALVCAALFTGAAFYVSFAEQPARMTLDERSQLTQWKPSYKRGAIMQASLAIAGFVLGVLAWFHDGRPTFLLGAVFMLANWPWTFIVIMPTNRFLMGLDPASAEGAVRARLMSWDRLHRARIGFGVAATLAFLWALS